DRELLVPAGPRRKIFVAIDGSSALLMVRNGQGSPSRVRIYGAELRDVTIDPPVAHGDARVEALAVEASSPGFNPVLLETQRGEGSFAASFALFLPRDLRRSEERRVGKEGGVGGEGGHLGNGSMEGKPHSLVDRGLFGPEGARGKSFVAVGGVSA